MILRDGYNGFGSLGVYSDPTLRLGSKGTAVITLRGLLSRCGYEAPGATDLYGPIVMGAVQQFQRAQGLTPDGIAGPNTWARLRQLTGSAAPSVPAVGPGPAPVLTMDEETIYGHAPMSTGVIAAGVGAGLVLLFLLTRR